MTEVQDRFSVRATRPTSWRSVSNGLRETINELVEALVALSQALTRDGRPCGAFPDVVLVEAATKGDQDQPHHPFW